MNSIRKLFGALWIAIGLAAIILLVYAAFTNIGHASGDIGKPIPWLIIILVFTPIAAGLVIFGWYALKGAYEDV